MAFHPTISIREYAHALSQAAPAARVGEALQNRFPNQSVILTDSGRSALALAIESLELSGKTVALPAFLCNVLLPVLEHYRITPLFLDVNPHTFQPPVEAYTKEVLNKADAVLLVATYGRNTDQSVYTLLKQHNKTVIEDFAHCPFPHAPEHVKGDARFYSLHKTLPVPDGGVAVLPHSATAPELPPASQSFTLVKETVKLLPGVAPLIAALRRKLKPEGMTLPEWRRATQPSPITKRLLGRALERHAPKRTPYTYCYPLSVQDPQKAEKVLAREGIGAERIWHSPIIMHPRTQSIYKVRADEYPATLHIARSVVCAPLWHISSEEGYQVYTKRLEKILAKQRSK